MPRNVKVLLFAASLRKESVNARLASVVKSIVERLGVEADHASMSDFDCPSYDQDAEVESMPQGAQRLRDRLLACDAFMIASPEYNASMSGVIKNTIDWVSRFRPQPFNGKQGFLLSASPSMAGGNRGLWALRVPLEHLGARIYPDMFSLAQAHTAFADDGRLANERLLERLESTIGCFLELVEAAKHYPAIKKHWVEFLGEKPDAATDRTETAATR
ncbi:MAG TPA: NAD(P)H-dependent oxidoreductase [Thermoanaerobaculia bacterium]|nr:NAD(P)H-dependent oxidoreductase [Thermoanaerobaculia bacterium]